MNGTHGTHGTDRMDDTVGAMSMEDRLREAYSTADRWTPDVPPPLREPTHSGHRRIRRGRFAAMLSGPGLAAASVVLVLVLVGGLFTAAGRQGLWGSPGGGRGHGSEPGSGSGGLTVPGAPRFYLSGEREVNEYKGIVAVYELRTRRRVATVPLKATQVTGTGDGTFFVLARTGPDPYDPYGRREIRRIRLTPEGKIADITRVPIPAIKDLVVGDVKATENGTKLVFAVKGREADCAGMPLCGKKAEVRVVDVRTGRITSWPVPTSGEITSLSADTEGRLLAFVWRRHSGSEEIRTVDLRHRERGLLSGRRVTVVKYGETDTRQFGRLALSPDGATVMVEAMVGAPDWRLHLQAYDVATGRFKGTPLTEPLSIHNNLEVGGDNTGGSFDVLQYDHTGAALLVHGGGFPLSVLHEGGLIKLAPDKTHNAPVIAAW